MEETLQNRLKQLTLFQEHLLRGAAMAAAQARLQKEGIRAIFQPALQNGYHSQAGVGAIMKEGIGVNITPLRVQAQELETYGKMGRVQTFKIAKGHGH